MTGLKATSMPKAPALTSSATLTVCLAHIADLLGTISGEPGTSPLAADHGVRFTLGQVAAFPAISPARLLGYLDDVRSDTKAFFQGLQLRDLDGAPEPPPGELVQPGVEC